VINVAALATLAAVSGTAFAQSSVSIIGNADVGYSKTSGAKGAFKHGGDNSTPAVKFVVVEDLGGGMKAEALYEINPQLAATTIGKGEAFVGLSGGFGTVRMGMPNTGLLATQAARTPFGTALGSNYGAQLGSADTANTRMNGAIQYRSPAIMGFGIVIDHAPAAATTAGLENNTIVTIGGKIAGVSLNYSNSQNHKGTTASRNDLSAQYTFSGVTLYAGHGKSDAAGEKAVNNIAAKYTMGATSLMGNFAKQGNAKSATFGVQYDLSKRTNVYAKYDKTAVSKTDPKTIALGLRHSF
jgi:predicted porin